MPGAAGWPVKLAAGGEVVLETRALATSSPLGTVFDAAGKVGHILNPVTGLPAAPLWTSVSISAASAAVADAVSTAGCLMPDRVALLAAPAFADGDAAKGADDFKRCKACHAITALDGTAIQKGGKTGPNLYGMIGRKVASVPDFKYGTPIIAAGAKYLVWDEAMLTAYVTDPTAWLEEQTCDPAAVAKMTFKMAKGGEDIAA
jgi:cytochrome c